MRRRIIWLVGGAAVLVYLALSWGLLGGGFDQGAPQIVDLAGQGSAVPTGSPASGTATPTSGPTPTRLPAGVIASQGDTFILVNAGTVTHNAHVGINGQGFLPNEPVVVTLRGEALTQDREVGRGFANKDGMLEKVGFDVPGDLPAGHYVVQVSAKSGRTAQAGFDLSGGAPGLEPDLYSAKPGTTVKVSGGGFKPGERVTVYFDSLDSTPLGTVEASASGTLREAPVTIPLSAEGDHAFLYVGDQSQSPVRVPITVTGLYPFITLDNYTPLPQQALGVTGEDFFPGERVFIYMNTVTPKPLAIVQAGPNGGISAPGAVSIPVDVRGTATVIARGEQSGIQTSADFTIGDFAPALELTVYSGAPGTTIAFTGSAFANDETVHVYEGRPEDKHELSSFQTGPSGAFKAVGGFQLPLDTTAGKLTLTAVGEKSQVPVSVVFSVQGFQPGLNLTSYAGKAGDTTAFSGSGYVPGEKLHAYLGQNAGGQEIASFQVGADGSFENAGGFVVPYGTPPGQLSVTVVGDQSKTPTTVQFTVLPFTPWAGLSAYAGPVGSKVRLIGGSFAPGEIVDVHLGDAKGKVVLSVTADDEGKFPLTDEVTVAETGGTDASFTLVGETSGGSVVVKYTITRDGGPGGAPANEQPKPTGAAPPSGTAQPPAGSPQPRPTGAPSGTAQPSGTPQPRPTGAPTGPAQPSSSPQPRQTAPLSPPSTPGR